MSAKRIQVFYNEAIGKMLCQNLMQGHKVRNAHLFSSKNSLGQQPWGVLHVQKYLCIQFSDFSPQWREWRDSCSHGLKMFKFSTASGRC